MKAQKKYVIQIMDFETNKVVFVSSWGSGSFCYWNKGESALFFDKKSFAESIVNGLNFNGFKAFLVTVPDYFNENLFINK